MTSGRGHRYLLTFGFLLVIAAVAPFQAASELREGESPQALDLFRQTPKAANIRSFEKDLENQSLVAKAVRPRMQYLRFRVLRDTGEQAFLGREGWWFYRPDVRYLTERCADDSIRKTGRRAAVSAIVSFRDQLAERGIHLLVIPVPGKPSIYPDMLYRGAAACDPRVHDHTRQVIEDLAGAGVETIDLFDVFAQARINPPVLSNPNYLVTDTHWTNEGARLAAETTAGRIRRLGWAPVSSVSYGLRSMLVRRPGDILRMLRCPSIEILYEPEQVACEMVVQPGDGKPYGDDPGAAILVIGDSFLRIYEHDEPRSAGFTSHLARELGQPLTSIVSDGGASTLVRQELARKPNLLENKRLVIWEFVERDIHFGMEGWQEVRMATTSRLKPVVSRSKK